MKKISTMFVVFALVLSTAAAFPVSVRAESDHNNNHSEEHSNDNHNNDNHENNHDDDNHGNEHGNNHDNNGDDHDDEHGDDDNHNTPVDLCINVAGMQTTVPEGLVANGNQCFPVVTTATISATKIVCDNESDLPNWGFGGGDITASTASDFIAAHPNTCHLEKDWKFQWAPFVASNPGDNVEVAGIPWTEFSTATNVNGVATAVIPAGSNVWVREEMKDTHVPFSGAMSDFDNVISKNSAEMYCSSDVLNYDNLDYVSSPVAGQTYHCVAFNAKKATTQCPIEDLNATGWYTDYFNYKSTDADMQDTLSAYDTSRGDPLSVASPWTSHWYDSDFYKFSRVDANLMFGDNFFPFDSTIYADAGEVTTFGHEFHFGTHSASKITVPTTGSYAYELTSDDDAWVYIDGALIVNNPGIHPANLVTGSVNLTAGNHIVDLYFAERHIVASKLTFKFLDEAVVVHPYSPLCEVVTPPTDVCSNIAGVQSVVPQGYHADGTQCLIDTPSPKACSDDSDNDEDTLTDELDPGCHTDGNASNSESYDPNDNDESNSVVIVDVCANIEGNQSTIPSGKVQSGENCVDPSGPSNPTDPTGPTGNGGANGPVNFGFVSAGNNGQVLGASCGMYMEKHIRLGSSKNDPEQVKKLQLFLNKWMGSSLPVTGVYNQATYNVVKSFQTKYGDDVLKPWGLKDSTGLVYLATLRKINKLECPELSLDLPTLVPWSRNPNAQ